MRNGKEQQNFSIKTTHQAICASRHSIDRIAAKNNAGPGHWKTTLAGSLVRRFQLSIRLPREVQGRLHFKKMGIVEEEADESSYWMEMIGDAELMKPEQIAPLMKEAGEIAAMVVASIRTAKGLSK